MTEEATAQRTRRRDRIKGRPNLPCRILEPRVCQVPQRTEMRLAAEHRGMD